MTSQAAVFVWAGLVAVGLLLYSKAGGSSGGSFLALLASPPPSPKIKSFATAIARAEGFYVTGSVADVACNPGNLKAGGQTIAGGITVYPSDGLGWAALYRQLQLIVDGRASRYRLSMSIDEMGDVWAPPEDSNIPGAWALNVAAQLGVNVNTPIGVVLV